MADAPYGDTYYRWEWFRRSQWWPGYRDSWQARRWRVTLGVLGDLAGKDVLDATCGLGRRTVLMSDLGIKVVGSDANSYAVKRARDLAASENRDIDFFVCSWRDLPERVPHLFDAIFVDAFVDCCEMQEGLVASLSGIASALKDGGAFVFSGAAPGERMRDIVESAWNCANQFSIAWQHREEDCECTCLEVMCRGDDFIDNHYLYLIKENGVDARLESWTMGRWFRWDWECVDAATRQVGFSSLDVEWLEAPEAEHPPFPRTIARK